MNTIEEKESILENVRIKIKKGISCGLSEQSKQDVGDVVIDFLNNPNFETLVVAGEKKELKKEVLDVIKDIADYVGVVMPLCKCVRVDEPTVNITQGEYKKMLKTQGKASAFKYLLANTDSIMASANSNNVLRIWVYSDSYYEKYQKMFNLTDNDIKRLKSNYETVISIRHECQHLLQLAKMKEYFLGKKVEEKYKIFALATYMKEALDDYKQKEDSGVAYFLDVLEIDARLSEVTYVKNILQRDSRLNKNTAKSMKNFIEENITTDNYYWDYEDEFVGKDIKLGDFAKMYFDMLKTEFEKEFGFDDFARYILSEFNSCDFERYYASLNRQESNIVNYYNKNAEERTL